MNILFFTYDFPYPTNSGGKTRAFNLLKYAKHDSRITLFSFIRESFLPSYKEELKKIGVESIVTFPRRPVSDIRTIPSIFSKHSIFHSLYFDKDIERKLLETVKEKRIEIVHLESFYPGYYLSEKLAQMGVKQIFGTENIEYLLYEGYSKYHTSLPFRIFYSSQVKKIRNEEEGFYKSADCVLTVTNEEKKTVSGAGQKSVVVIENGVDVSLFKNVKARPENTLLFVGNFSYYPNVDAMQWFMKDVFPHLSNKVKIIVVGKKSAQMPFLRTNRVRTEEFVENIDDLFALGTVLIAPVRIGGGTNFKILEAMASRLPVVALSDRVSAFDFVNGKEILIAKNAEEFAEHIEHALSDASLRKKLSDNAYKAVQGQYDWTKIGTKLYNTWNSVLHEKH